MMKSYRYLLVLLFVFSTANASDCSVVTQLWKNFGRVSTSDPSKKDGCCLMQGVTCIGESVININWTDQSLVGTILPEIGSLKELTILSLSSNSISGSIPAEIGNLAKLERLEIMSNQLTGAIPSSIGQLNSLSFLKLWNNQLAGSIPSSLGKCRELRVLWLGRNRLSGNIPPDLEMLDKLEQFLVPDNQLSETISSCVISGMTSLLALDLSNNPNLTGAIWPPSKRIELNAGNTNLTECSSESQSPACISMKCIRPENGKILSWWIILLLVIVWVIILAIIGTYIISVRADREMSDEEDIEKSEADDVTETEIDDDASSVVTKIDGIKQGGKPRSTIYSRKSWRNTVASKSTTISRFFTRSLYGDYDSYDNNKLYTVVQPHTPANDDEIELVVGECVLIMEQFEDGWAFGLNKDKGETGVFPLVCLK